MIFRIGKDYYTPEPSDDRLAQYYDDPSKAGIVLAMAWAVFGLARRRLGGVATGLSGPHLRRRLVELRPDPPGAHYRA